MSATATIFIDQHGDVIRGTPIPMDEFEKVRNYLHKDLNLCDAVFPVHDESTPRTNQGLLKMRTAAGRTFHIAEDWEPESCEFCTNLAARIVGKFAVEAR